MSSAYKYAPSADLGAKVMCKMSLKQKFSLTMH